MLFRSGVYGGQFVSPAYNDLADYGETEQPQEISPQVTCAPITEGDIIGENGESQSAYGAEGEI